MEHRVRLLCRIRGLSQIDERQSDTVRNHAVTSIADDVDSIAADKSIRTPFDSLGRRMRNMEDRKRRVNIYDVQPIPTERRRFGSHLVDEGATALQY
jgi:hypothetical protein